MQMCSDARWRPWSWRRPPRVGVSQQAASMLQKPFSGPHSPNFLFTLFTIYSNSVILNKNSVSYARMIDYHTGTRSPPRDRLGAGGADWLLQLTLYPHCMNVTSNPVIYCLEGSVQFFLPDQIAHFLEKEAKIFQHMDCSHPHLPPSAPHTFAGILKIPSFSLPFPLSPSLLDTWPKKWLLH